MAKQLFSSITLMTEPVTALLSLGGSELNNSRRYVDLYTFEACRWQYDASQTIDVRIDYSLDDGATWQMFADEYDTGGSGPRLTAWQIIPDAAKVSDVLLRCFAVGSGLLTTVNFVEFQFR